MDVALKTTSPVDADKSARPGVPELKEPVPAGHAHWVTPPRQPPRDDVLKDASRAELTATFGTSPAPHGLSGLLRRLAYRVPDYRAKRWALLLVADRIDAFEDRARVVAKHPVTWVVAATALALLLRPKRRPALRLPF